MNPYTHDVLPLASLTDEQRAKWIAEDAATKAFFDKHFPVEQMRDATAEQVELRRRFAQPPVIPGAPGADRRGGFDALGRPRR